MFLLFHRLVFGNIRRVTFRLACLVSLCAKILRRTAHCSSVCFAPMDTAATLTLSFSRQREQCQRTADEEHQQRGRQKLDADDFVVGRKHVLLHEA